MSVIGWVVLITSVAGVAGTGLGGVIGAIFKKDSSKVVSLLLSFAAGVMLAVVCFDLIPESISIENNGEIVPIWIPILGIIFSYIIVYILNFFIDKNTNKEVKHITQSQHPKTADDLDELIHADHLLSHQESGSSKSQLFIAGIVMAFAIALHNVPEGMVIGASYANDSTSLVSGSGFIIAMIIAFHNIPEGMAVSVPLIAGGMKKWQSILITAATGIPTILGSIFGFYIGAINPIGLAIALSMASGAMLYVVFSELLPEAFLMFKSKLPAFFVLVGVLLGLILVNI